jgi:hypothetical protein
MTSFTGPEIASLLAVGRTIVSSRQFSDMLEREIANATSIFRAFVFDNYSHWVKGVYIITEVSEGQADHFSSSDDQVTAVNLSRPIPKLSSAQQDIVSTLTASARRKYAGISKVHVEHYLGGPCDADEPITCIVPGGAYGWTVFCGPNQLGRALLVAFCRGARQQSEQQGQFSGGQVVRFTGLQARQDLNAQQGMLLRFDRAAGRWEVRVDVSGEGVRVRPVNLESAPGCGDHRHGTLMVFWGNACWTRAQLLGEIAKGSWGMCTANTTDFTAAADKRWPALLDSPRLAFAPISEMSEDYMHRARQQLEALAPTAAAAAMGQQVGEGDTERLEVNSDAIAAEEEVAEEEEEVEEEEEEEEGGGERKRGEARARSGFQGSDV